MRSIRLICWNEDLAQARARILEDAGLPVDASPLKTQGFVSHFKAAAPSAVLIDLDRLPSHGRECAVALRTSKTTRHLPIVFAGGDPAKVEAIRRELPDAAYTDWSGVVGALKQAITSIMYDPVLPTPHMQRFAGTPLPKKLGIKADSAVALLGAPNAFEESLGELPEGVQFKTALNGQTRLALWFVRSRAELEAAVEQLAWRLPQGGSVWIVHPKQQARRKLDFNENDVRETGLAAGLVDYKVCSVNAEWSGLKFARRKS